MKILVVANGDATELGKLVIPEHDLVLCADGGANLALALGLKIHTVVGDFDSLNAATIQRLESKNVQLLKFSADKDLTDLELCLLEALKFNPTEINLISALGARVDHHLANIFLLSRIEFAGIKIRIVAHNCAMQYVRGGERLVVEGRSGETFSLIVLTPEVKGVNIQGARWELKNATLSFGEARTVSNSFLDRPVRIEVGSGTVLFVYCWNAG